MARTNLLPWRRKAQILRALARLPPFIGDPTHYGVQRYCGGLRRSSAPEYLKAAATLQSLASKHGRSFVGSRVLEVGAGWSLSLAIAMYLAGAAEVWSVDVTRLARESLVLRELHAFRREAADIEAVFGAEAVERLDRISTTTSMTDLLAGTRIRYLAPADAANLDLPSGSVDLHVSRSVFEHVPANELRAILKEAARVVGTEGLLLHIVDLSDHFAHEDRTIILTNFLQYSEVEWDRLAGNRFAYMNRLRLPELLTLFEDAGLTPLTMETFVNPRSRDALSAGFPLAERFRRFDADTNTTTEVHIAARRTF